MEPQRENNCLSPQPPVSKPPRPYRRTLPGPKPEKHSTGAETPSRQVRILGGVTLTVKNNSPCRKWTDTGCSNLRRVGPEKEFEGRETAVD